MPEFVVLVDQEDKPIGTMEKMEAHEKGLLHRAFSVFIFNRAGEMLIHRRAHHKYHSGGLWTNACCSHPRENETPVQAAHRRLVEEMGFDCELEKAFEFTYKSKLDNDLYEHEYDHVFIGEYGSEPPFNPDEVADFKYLATGKLLEDIEQNPANYTEWFKIAVKKVIDFKTSRAR